MVKGLVLGKTTRGEKKREEERRREKRTVQTPRMCYCATCYAYVDESYFTLMSLLLLLPPSSPPVPPPPFPPVSSHKVQGACCTLR